MRSGTTYFQDSTDFLHIFCTDRATPRCTLWGIAIPIKLMLLDGQFARALPLFVGDLSGGSYLQVGSTRLSRLGVVTIAKVTQTHPNRRERMVTDYFLDFRNVP